ncbi:MAG: T9SS type A sorting domain-containing protein [Bacteroidales bacterium]|nr:T9SS type A sorting domain-containing protein [Bacteroidales bacterium]
MKTKFLFSLILAFSAMMSQAQITISAARNLGVGATVTVKGIVTNGSELGIIRYFQDGTGGIAAYGSNMSTVQRGDSILVTGVLKNYNQLLEIDPVTSVSVINSGNTLPQPEVVVPDSMIESRESKLVRINNATFTTNPGGLFSSNTSYNFTANGQTSSIYVRSGHPLIGQVVPSGPVSLIGIVSQFSYSSPTTGYQLLCRDSNDIVNSSSISVISSVTLDSLSTTGFTIDWQTDAAGTSEMFFGTTAALGNHQSDTNKTANHHLKISGATPSQLYYIQAFSVLGTDTAFAPVRVFVTQSVSSGNMLVYFNTPADHTVSSGTNAITLPNAIDDTLIKYIDRATETIDFTMYNFNSANIANVATALNNAVNRGVTVRVIFDNGANNTGIQQLDPSIGKISNPTGSQYGIMHNKFIIFDAHSTNPNRPIVWTGSTNLTEGQINTDPNNVIIIQDKSLALAYTLEFDEMFGSTTGTPSLSNSKFGPDKIDNTPHEFIIGSSKVECYFSPSDGTNDIILGQIGGATTKIDIATMLITRSDIAYALDDAVTDNNVALKVLVNHENDCSVTVWGILSTLIGNNLQDDQSQTGIMHHKFMVVDNDLATASVLTGSHNWSNAANNTNDENTLVIYNESVANQYYQAFYYRFMQNLTNDITDGNFAKAVNVYPIPADNQINIQIEGGFSSSFSAQIFSLDGKSVKTVETLIGTNVSVDIQSLESGVYILHLFSNSGNYITKFVVK